MGLLWSANDLITLYSLLCWYCYTAQGVLTVCQSRDSTGGRLRRG